MKLIKCFLILYFIAIGSSIIYVEAKNLLSNRLQVKEASNGYPRKSSITDAGSGSVFYLDRQTVDCGAGSAITAFHLFRPDPNSLSYEFDCNSDFAVSKSKVISKQNPFTDTGGDEKHSAHYLDRQSVNCQSGFALQKFKLERSGNQVGYSFTCVEIKSQSCGRINTKAESRGNYETYYLDRQYIMLPKGQVLTGFHLVTRDTEFFYEVDYCVLDNTNPNTVKPTIEDNSNKNSISTNLNTNLNSDILNQDEKLISKNGKFFVIMQSDGNLVFYSSKEFNGKGKDEPKWASDTMGKGTPPYKLVMQGDGNLVVYDGKSQSTWASNTNNQGKAPYHFKVRDEGNIDLFYLTENGNKSLWQK